MTTILARLMTFFLNSVIAICLFSMINCASPGPTPKWNGKIWKGKSKHAGVIFTGTDGKNEILRADDPRFDDFSAMSDADLRAFLAAYLYGCREWK